MTRRTLTPIEVDTIRVALALLVRTPVRSDVLEDARGDVAAPAILSDADTRRLSDELSPGTNPLNAVQLHLTIGGER
jgi:hypothetical protein